MNELQRVVKPTFVKEIKQYKQYVGDKTNLTYIGILLLLIVESEKPRTL